MWNETMMDYLMICARAAFALSWNGKTQLLALHLEVARDANVRGEGANLINHCSEENDYYYKRSSAHQEFEVALTRTEEKVLQVD